MKKTWLEKDLLQIEEQTHERLKKGKRKPLFEGNIARLSLGNHRNAFFS
jgi:hypothetical protein